MKAVIVSGANGFVGSALVHELLKNDYRVVALDQAGCSGNLPDDERVIFVPCDLSEMVLLKKKLPEFQYEFFFHFAWIGSVGPQRADTAIQLQNAQWTVDALRAAKELGCRRFLCAGSIMEQESLAAAWAPGSRPGPGYIYGGGKLIAHMMCMSVAAQIGIELVWPQITNAYGIGENSPRLVNTTLKKCIHKEVPTLTAGTQNYDFVYIDDVARAFLLIAEKGKPFHSYLIGSGAARPLRDFLMEMKEAVAPDLEFSFGSVPFTGINLPLHIFDTSRTEEDTGFKATIGFAEGCRQTIDWLRLLEEKEK